MIQNPAVRKAIYVVAAIVLGILAAHGLITADDADRLQHLVEAVLALVNVMAASHTPPSKP